MVRWRFALVLALLLLMPSAKLQDDDEEEPNDDSSEGDNGDDDDEGDDEAEKPEEPVGRRAPALLLATTRSLPVTRTTKKRPLECYVCAYKSDTPLKACLDPTKYRVQTITCHSVDDKCATSVISKGSSFEAVVRTCKSSCIGTTETTCCDLNRCNNQAFALPTVVAPKALVHESSKTSKSFPHSVLFFVTILLVLQTVVKVTFV